MADELKDNSPVIVGIGQCIHKPEEPADAVEPLDLVEKAIQKAVIDSGMESLLQKIDAVGLVNILSWQFASLEDLNHQFSEKIGIRPQRMEYTWIGASAPQWFVNQFAEKFLKGKSRIGLICGGEAFSSKKIRDKATGTGSGLTDFPGKMPWMVGDLREPLTPLELKYGLMLPIHIYPFFENALRHYEGMSIEQQQRELGDFCAAFSSIAAENPYSWFKEKKTSDEIVEVSDSNRMISFPYTKSMCSIMQVDQAAALILTDERTALELGIPKEKWIYLLGSGDASDIWHISERINYHSSPSVEVAAKIAMDQANVTLNDIDYFDLYSCFPSAPRITRNMLNIPKEDPRPLTVTGGMPYFGGPGNNYSLHAICQMVESLRKDRKRIGMVEALSWFINKHSIGIYSGSRTQDRKKHIDHNKYKAELNNLKGPDLLEEASGEATIETYTLFHNREGSPEGGVVIGRMSDNSRFLAKIEGDSKMLEAMTKQETIGSRGKVRSKDGFNYFSLI